MNLFAKLKPFRALPLLAALLLTGLAHADPGVDPPLSCESGFRWRLRSCDKWNRVIDRERREQCIRHATRVYYACREMRRKWD